jgi:Protein of unknown function (DUF3143)
MTLPSADTPLYNYPLPEIEQWLISHGCEHDIENIHCWNLQTTTWSAKIWLEVDSIVVQYLNAAEDGRDIQRAFKYSLSRKDLDSAIFAGP